MITPTVRSGRFAPGFSESPDSRLSEIVSGLQQMRELTIVLRDKGHDQEYCDAFLAHLDDLGQAVSISVKVFDDKCEAIRPQLSVLLPVVIGAVKPVTGEALAEMAMRIVAPKPATTISINASAFDMDDPAEATQAVMAL